MDAALLSSLDSAVVWMRYRASADVPPRRICSVMSLNPYFGSLVKSSPSEFCAVGYVLTINADSCAEGDGKAPFQLSRR
jgi:hypothetical protein